MTSWPSLSRLLRFRQWVILAKLQKDGYIVGNSQVWLFSTPLMAEGIVSRSFLRPRIFRAGDDRASGRLAGPGRRLQVQVSELVRPHAAKDRVSGRECDQQRVAEVGELQ